MDSVRTVNFMIFLLIINDLLLQINTRYSKMIKKKYFKGENSNVHKI